GKPGGLGRIVQRRAVLIVSFVVCEKEELVAHDGPAKGAAILLTIERNSVRLSVQRNSIRGIESGKRRESRPLVAASVDVSITMEIVGAGFRNNVYRSA